MGSIWSWLGPNLMARPGSASRWATATAPFQAHGEAGAHRRAQRAKTGRGGGPERGWHSRYWPDGSGYAGDLSRQRRRHVPGAVLYWSGAQSRRNSGREPARPTRYGGQAGPSGAGHLGRRHGAGQHEQITMPYLVNGQPVPEEWIREEEQRLGHDLRFNAIADKAERERQLRIAAQHSAIDRMLVEQAAAQDSRPVDPQAVEQEVQRQKQASNCRTAFDDSFLRQSVERQFRLQRTHAEMVAGAAQPPSPHACV